MPAVGTWLLSASAQVQAEADAKLAVATYPFLESSERDARDARDMLEKDAEKVESRSLKTQTEEDTRKLLQETRALAYHLEVLATTRGPDTTLEGGMSEALDMWRVAFQSWDVKSKSMAQAEAFKKKAAEEAAEAERRRLQMERSNMLRAKAEEEAQRQSMALLAHRQEREAFEARAVGREREGIAQEEADATRSLAEERASRSSADRALESSMTEALDVVWHDDQAKAQVIVQTRVEAYVEELRPVSDKAHEDRSRARRRAAGARRNDTGACCYGAVWKLVRSGDPPLSCAGGHSVALKVAQDQPLMPERASGS